MSKKIVFNLWSLSVKGLEHCLKNVACVNTANHQYNVFNTTMQIHMTSLLCLFVDWNFPISGDNFCFFLLFFLFLIVLVPLCADSRSLSCAGTDRVCPGKSANKQHIFSSVPSVTPYNNRKAAGFTAYILQTDLTWKAMENLSEFAHAHMEASKHTQVQLFRTIQGHWLIGLYFFHFWRNCLGVI